MPSSAPLNCTTRGGYTCEPGKGGSKIKQQSEANALIAVDPGNKTVKTPYRTDLLPIANSVLNNEQLQLQGTSEKFAWSAVINRQTGKVTITVADRVGTYVMFGRRKVGGGT